MQANKKVPLKSGTRKLHIEKISCENAARKGGIETSLRGFTLTLLMFLQNALLENIRRLERHHTPREDRHFLTRLGVTTDTLVLVANLKCRKRRQFHRFAIDDSVTDFIEYHLDQSRRFRSGKAYLTVNSLCRSARVTVLPPMTEPAWLAFEQIISLRDRTLHK